MDAYTRGYHAWQDGLPRSACPYLGGEKRDEWMLGWDDAAAENCQFGVGA